MGMNDVCSVVQIPMDRLSHEGDSQKRLLTFHGSPTNY